MPLRNIRNKAISVFVVVWCLAFHYESLRVCALDPLFGRELPKIKFLFPPAGWIMFYRVEEAEVRAEVYGLKNRQHELIDPHRIFNIHWLGYDNIRRNVLVTVLDPSYAGTFGPYLHRKFPEFDRFAVVEALYPSNIRYPGKKLVQVIYEC